MVTDSKGQRAANQLLRALDREIFDGTLDVEDMPQAVEIVCRAFEAYSQKRGCPTCGKCSRPESLHEMADHEFQERK